MDLIWGEPCSRIIRLLAEADLRATFFLVGRDLEYPPAAERLRELVAAGHELAVHSYSHPQAWNRLTAEQKKDEIQRTADLIEKLTGRHPVGFRAPGWNIDEMTLDILADCGFLYDSSVFPTALSPFLKLIYGAITRFQLPTLGRWEYLFAPVRPYHPGERLWWRGQRRLWEIPLSVTPDLKLPMSSTFDDWIDFRGFNARLDRQRHIGLNYAFHAADFLDPAETCDYLAQYGKGRYIPRTLGQAWKNKEPAWRRILAAIRSRFACRPLAEWCELLAAAEAARVRPAEPPTRLRVLLLFPAAPHAVRAMYTFHNEDKLASLGAKPPLGLLYLATHLRAHSQHAVRIVDGQAEQLDEAGWRRMLRDWRPDVVGVSAWTDFWYDAWRMLQVAREELPAAHLTVGGPHVLIFPGETLEASACDSIVMGDGEVPFLELVERLAAGRALEGIPGVYTRGRPPRGGFLPYFEKDLDRLELPDRTLLPAERYRSLLGSEARVATMITSRGCPWHCVFCRITNQKTVGHSAAHVLREFEAIAALGFREIEIYDDTFTWSRERLKEICEALRARNLGLSWSIRERVSNVTPETLRWLKEAGCRNLHLGIESGDEEVLKRSRKNISVAEARRAVKLAKQAGLEVLTYFMIGLPGDTEATVRRSLALALELDPDFTTFSVAVPYPGTEMYREALARGIIARDFWLDYARSPVPDLVIPGFYEEHLRRDDLLRLRNTATRVFYFRPRYILRQTLRVKNWGEFSRKARMALGLFRIAIMKRGASLYARPTGARPERDKC